MIPCRLSFFASSVLYLIFLAASDARLQQSSRQSSLRFSSCKLASIDRLVVFGDSFSDTGNVLQLTNGTWPLSAFYPAGRYTNGPVWTDYVAMDRQLKLSNFAYGSATTDSEMVQGRSGPNDDIPVPGFMQQIDNYLDSESDPSENMDSTLFVVNFQGNDFYFDPTLNATMVMAKIERGIHRIVRQVGARHVLVFENVDFGRLPAYLWNQTLAEKMSAVARNQHNEYQDLIKRLGWQYGSIQRGSQRQSFLNCSIGKVNIAFFDILALYKRLQDPRQLEKMGILDLAHACVDDEVWTGCRDPEKFYYYDPSHPTTKIHRQVANEVLQMF